ncbi:hydantoinase/oxoprolinase family protein [Pseudonocardia halophobica]|uniref:Hydantoinase n=1 Tax=Pseudonocardia halophobica TaxID=29401 RepID=A0A9W6NYL6_9PSEU|nr:hydantoinase/oxoprolinase family protein [Pseudonocardia halophobica]GLL14009.1 hydantoinase [Pseudonocardia halophobica]
MIGVDVGGTFTDVVAVDGGEIRTIKVATAARTEEGVLAGAREAGVEHATTFNHASTHGLNAVITRRLPKVAFLTTMGHRDILDAGRTWRPAEALTDAHWRRSFGDASRPLVPRYLRRGIRERITADGGILIPLDEEHARAELEVLRDCAVEGVAICLLNAYVSAHHEERLRELVAEVLGDVPCSISSEVSPLAKEFARSSTTVVDVFMRIIYDGYTSRLDAGLREAGFRGELNYANCAAQLVAADVAVEHPYQIVFAGPAAGTVAGAHFGSLIDAPNLLCADIGGTSCDISLVTAGEPSVDTTFQLEHDLVVNALSTEVVSIGAGGGSLVTISPAGELQVGPGSAGSVPGPACYGRGGVEPATTDTMLLMGILDPDGFAGGRMRLDPDLSRQAFEALDTPLTFDQRVDYAFRTAVANVAEGLFNVAVKHGIDPRDYSLLAFGAAGPMLLPAALDLIHAREVVIPPHPGLFSALGLVSSDQVYGDSRSSYTILEPGAAESIEKVYTQMEERLAQRFGDRGEKVRFVRTFDALLVGQTWETPFVGIPDGPITPETVQCMIANFHDVYEQRTGNRFEALPVQGVTYRVEAVFGVDKVEYPRVPRRETGGPTPSGELQLRYLGPEPLPAGEYQRADLRAGDTLVGPAVVREPLSTTFVPPDHRLTVGEYGELHIRLEEAQ